jgi:adenylate cyclase
MKNTRKKPSKKIIAPVISVLVFAVVVLLHLSGALYYPEYKAYDFRVGLLANFSRPSDDIVLVLLDQSSIDWAVSERGWSWPWPRRAYAEIVDYMNLSGAQAIAFDVLFSEPSVYGNEDDAAFIEASNKFGRVVQAVYFSTQPGQSYAWPGDLRKPRFRVDEKDARMAGLSLAEDAGSPWSAVFPVSGIRDSAGALGYVTGKPDRDSVFRRMNLFAFFDGNAVPELAAASLLAAGYTNEIRYDKKTRRIEWGEYVIPTGKNGEIILNFRGSLDRYIPYTAGQILRSAERYGRGEEPELFPEDFSGKYVLFGFNASGLFDIATTPISSTYPGVGMHITLLDNLLQGDFIRESPLPLDILIILIPIILITACTLFSNRIPLVVSVVVLILAAVIGTVIGAYFFAHLWLPMVAPLAGILAAFLVATLYNYATEGSQKRFIKSAFSQYLSPVYIDQLIANPEQLKLGGEKRDMSAIFTDVRSFSTISEALDDPEKLVELLNFYLTKMSNIVLENQGTIDKYEGDAIIAFFGAPIHMEDHAALACRSAVLMKRAEAELNREVIGNGLINEGVLAALQKKGAVIDSQNPAPLYTRIGINSGDMVVGNMGTPNKMDYTIMGNNVNLAARLEGVNKQYNTGGILISEYTRARIGDEFILRSLDRVRVVGIDTPLRLYELLELRESASQALLDKTGRWEAAIGSYEKRDFAGAGRVFNGLYAQNNQDLTVKLYLERCEMYLKTPPAADWDAINNLTQK